MLQSLLRRAAFGLVLATVGCGSVESAVDTADGSGDPDARADAIDGVDASTGDGSDSAPDDSMGTGDATPSDSPDIGPDPPVKLPGSIPGVEPEAHAHHPPMIDGKGNLYRVTESSASDGNRPRMMKSSDSGATWSEVDATNRPSATDLEGCWQLQVGSTIYLSVTNNRRVWWSSFHTSDAADKPDRWVLNETVETDLGNTGGVVQFSSSTRTPDGQFWLFYSDTMISGRQQIGFRRRSATGAWSSKEKIGDSIGSWTGPKTIAGASGVTHIFYKDHIAHQLLWRTLSAAGLLSGGKRVESSGTSVERLPHTNAIHYDKGGAETVVVAFATNKGELHAVTITSGVVGAEETISTAAVLQNPSIALNDGVVAHLALDGTTVHALWSDLATGDVKHSFREDGKAWTAPTTAWTSGPSIAWWVYGNVYVRAGRRRLAFTYDIGAHADDVGKIEYNEITLGP